MRVGKFQLEPMEMQYRRHHAQPQTAALQPPRLGPAVKASQYSLAFICRDARPVILNLDGRNRAISPNRDANVPTGIFDCIIDKIVERFEKQAAIREDLDIFNMRRLQRYARLLGQWLVEIDNVADERRQRNVLESRPLLPRLDFRDAQKCTEALQYNVEVGNQCIDRGI